MATDISKVAVGVVMLALAVSAAAAGPWGFTYRNMTARYVIYGGTLGDPNAPTSKDKKIAFAIHGNVAKEMFDAIGPDMKGCGSEGGRERTKGEIDCMYTNAEGYTCWVGFDLKTGKSIGGSVC